MTLNELANRVKAAGGADAKLLRSLTKAQREAVLDGYVGNQTNATINALWRKRLFSLRIDSSNDRCGFMELTNLGRDVQAALRVRAQETTND